MNDQLEQTSPNMPTDPRSLKRLERYREEGEFGEVRGMALPSVPRYLITYMSSQTRGRIRSATIVSITNQSDRINRVFVSYFRGFTNNVSPVGMSAFAIPPDFTVDFGSRNLPVELTAVNSVCNPELVFDEGRAIVSSMWPEIGVSARVYYTTGERDEQLLAITDSKVVVFGQRNRGD